MTKITVEYSHDPANLQIVYLARVPSGRAPLATEWVPALRDTVRGRGVVWARFDDSAPTSTPLVTWLRDRTWDKQVNTLTIF